MEEYAHRGIYEGSTYIHRIHIYIYVYICVYIYILEREREVGMSWRAGCLMDEKGEWTAQNQCVTVTSASRKSRAGGEGERDKQRETKREREINHYDNTKPNQN
jgi:hypothetical protein